MDQEASDGDEGLKELIKKVNPQWRLLWTGSLQQVFGEAAREAFLAHLHENA